MRAGCERDAGFSLTIRGVKSRRYTERAMATNGALAVQLLGSAKARLGAHHLPFIPDKRYQLLAYLAHQGDWVSRDKLAFLFWPDTESANAKQNLRGLLKRVHALAWVTDLETDNHQLRWQVETDVAAFRKAAEEQRLDEAISLYTGPLLRGLETDEAAEFSEWLELERGRFHSSWREAVFGRARELEEAARDKEAAYLLSRLLREDDLDEEALRAYMSAAARAGQKEDALGAYSDFAKRLNKELSMEPTSSTQQLREKLQELEAVSVRVDVLGPPSSAPTAGQVITPLPLSSIPASSTSFVGRDVELAEIVHLLSQPECRLLTLTGPGGIGKTRLALEVARDREGSYQNGVFFVPLDSLSAPEAIPVSIAQALGLALQGTDDPLLQISRHIGQKDILLVLDNFEHLLGGATLASALLAACLNLKMLATSRERLNLAEEWPLNIEGLALPSDAKDVESDAVTLFVRRATQVLPYFVATDETLPDIIHICRMVQGSPLAIELAAAWIRLMSPSDIAREIETNLDLLSTSTRNVPERQRSIRAAFEYSWNLLTGKEQEALRKLSVFRGGFTREAAAVATGTPVAVLAALLDKSLLRVTEGGRYDRHPLLYQFTQEKLAEYPEEQAEIQDRHGRFFFHFLQEQNRRWGGGEQKAAYKVLEEELENVTTAWQWAVAGQRVRELREAIQLLYLFYEIRNRFQESMGLLVQAITGLSEDDPDHHPALGLLLIQQAWNYFRLHDFETCRQLAKRGLELRRPDGDYMVNQFGLTTLAAVAFATGDYAGARRAYEESLAFCRERGETRFIVGTLHNLGTVENALGNYEKARQHLEEGLSLNRQSTNDALVASTQSLLGEVLLHLGKPDEALPLLQEGLALARERGARFYEHQLLMNLARACLALGDRTQALENCHEALQMAQQDGAQETAIGALLMLGEITADLGNEAQAEAYIMQGLEIAWTTQGPVLLTALAGLAKLRFKQGQVDEAARLMSLVVHNPKTAHAIRTQAEQVLKELEDRLAPEVLAAGLEQGRAQSLDEVVKGLLQSKYLRYSTTQPG